MGTEPITTRDADGVTVTAYRVTFDGRKMTVHGPTGPRTRTCRARTGTAQRAMLRAMGYRDLFALCPDGTPDVFCFTTRLVD
jgi:hypothetical protein